MITIFNEVFTDFKDTLASNPKTQDVKTSSISTNMPNDFPFVSLEEIGNSIYQQGMDDCKIENFANIDMEANIFTQGNKRKTRANEILQVVDTFFEELGFIRMSKNDLKDNTGTAYCIVVRYSAVVSKDHTVYRR